MESRKESLEGAGGGSGELPDALHRRFLASVADHNSEHGVFLAVVAARLHSSVLRCSTLYPANVQ